MLEHIEVDLLGGVSTVADFDVKLSIVLFMMINGNLYLQHSVFNVDINPLKTKRRPLYLKTQSVPRCEHFSSGL